MYRCANCGELIGGNISIVGFQCNKCGGRIFYKERPQGEKKIIIAE